MTIGKKAKKKLRSITKTEAHIGQHGKVEQLQAETNGRSFQEGRHGRPSQKRGRTTMKQGVNEKTDRHHTVYLARQHGVFRGHNESKTSLNKIHFLELVQLLSKYDSTIKMHHDQINKIHSK